MISMKISELLERKAKICNKIAGIGKMRRGTLNEYYHTSTLKDGTVKKRGPFYNITYSGENGKTVSKSVSRQDIERIRQETTNYRTFRELSDEYADICEKITILSQPEDEAKKK
ncbi:MAG: hypothetical protein LBB56_06630 [Chitinispirillales bacterium]|jgi:hypothetical protein|nr:hypothetical protein [Chitinispirillales bacterium]